MNADVNSTGPRLPHSQTPPLKKESSPAKSADPKQSAAISSLSQNTLNSSSVKERPPLPKKDVSLQPTNTGIAAVSQVAIGIAKQRPLPPPKEDRVRAHMKDMAIRSPVKEAIEEAKKNKTTVLDLTEFKDTLTDEHLKEIAKLTHLNELKFNAKRITTVGMQSLEKLVNLEKISIDCLFYNQGDALAGLKMLPKLKNLTITHAYRLKGSDFIGFKALKQMNLAYVGYFTSAEEKNKVKPTFDDGLADALNDLTELTELHFTHCTLTGNFLKELHEKRARQEIGIEKMTFDRCDQFQTTNMQYLNELPIAELHLSIFFRLFEERVPFDHLAKIQGLRKLNLSQNDFTDEQLGKLSTLENLEELNLDKVRDLKTLESLKKFKKLKKLNISIDFSSLTKENVIGALKELPQLRELTIGYQPRELQCKDLIPFKNLEKVHVYKSEATYEDILALAKSANSPGSMLKEIDVSALTILTKTQVEELSKYVKIIYPPLIRG